MPSAGIHHVTAIAGNAQANLDFYTGLLGLRLVKLTVNYDDPGTYHFYFGNQKGEPGTILTFFPWQGIPRGRAGVGQVTAVAFAVRSQSLDFWKARLAEKGLAVEQTSRFGHEVLSFADPDGMRIELVATDSADAFEPANGLPAEHGLRGFFGVTMTLAGINETAALLKEHFGFREEAKDGERVRYTTGSKAGVIDLVAQPDGRRGLSGAGTVHHVALRAENRTAQEAVRSALADEGFNVTPVLDRSYFESIYFREPGGVIFEVATDPPGFTVDEPADALGSRLVLPAHLEPARTQLEASLPKIKLPEVTRS